MKNINLIIDGELQTVKVERYFKNMDHAYIIYSIDEPDTDGNVKIFIAKIKNHNQVLLIDTQEEWNEIKNLIVGIVSDNKEEIKLDIEDLNYKILENLEIDSTAIKALRLPVAVMPYLSANMPDFNNFELIEQEYALEEKTEALKEINANLTTLMDEMSKEFSMSENLVENNSPKENELEATMEIIMPSKITIDKENTENEESKKKKGKFSLKSLFGKKETLEEDKVEEEKTETIIEQLSEQIVHETELPTPVELDPIVVENDNIVLETADLNLENINMNDSLENKEQDLLVEPEINYIIESNNVDLPQNMSAGFEFFDVPEMPEIKILPREIELEELPFTSSIQEEETMEILDLDEDINYKKMYEEEKKNKEILEEKNNELEQIIKDYQTKLAQIKDIVG